MEDEIDAEGCEHHDGEYVVEGCSDVVGHKGGLDAAVFEDGADHAHNGAAGQQTRSEQGALFAAQLVESLVFAAVLDEPGQEAAHEEGQVELQGDEHTQGEREGGHAEDVEEDGQHGTDDVEQPGSLSAEHQGLDDGGHCVGLRGHQGAFACVAVGVGEQHNDGAHGQGRHERAHELEGLLLEGRGADPVTDFQVGDEAAGHRKCRADDAAHHQGDDDAGAALEAHGGEDERGENERHHRHSRHRVGAHRGDGRGGHGCEQEGEQEDHQDAHDHLQRVHLHPAQDEEDGHQHNHHGKADEDDLHRDVALGAQHGVVGARLLAGLEGHAQGFLDDAGRLGHAQESGHRDAADADVSDVVGEDEVGVEGAHRGHSAGDVSAAVLAKQRHEHPPGEGGAGADDGRVFEADQVAGAQQDGLGAHLEDELVVHRQSLAPAAHTGGDGVGPEVEGGHQEIIQAADKATDEQELGLVAVLGARDDDLRGGCGLRERVFAVHLGDEVFAERNQEQDTQEAAEQRGQEHLPEADLYVGPDGGVGLLDDVDGGKGEDGAGHDDAGAGADGLDEHVLGERALALGECGDAHGDDGDGDGGLEHLSEPQAGVGRGGGEDDGHYDAPRNGPGIQFGVLLFPQQDGLVGFALLELAVRVVGQLDVFRLRGSLLSDLGRFFFFHILKMLDDKKVFARKWQKYKKNLFCFMGFISSKIN